jgi:uncharacterized membrane protein YphA (DoxX/SURF4 family)
MDMSLKIVIWLIGLLFAFMGLNTMFDPLANVESLGLTPVGEQGLNTVRGDIAGLFLTCTVLLVLGLIKRRAEWFLAVAVLMAVIAFGRVVGFVLDGSPTDTTLTAFAFEIVIAAVMILASRRLVSR